MTKQFDVKTCKEQFVPAEFSLLLGIQPILERIWASTTNIYLTLQAFINRDETRANYGFAWCSQETLADLCSVSVRQVQRALSLLEELGMIERQHRGRGRTDLIYVKQLPSLEQIQERILSMLDSRELRHDTQSRLKKVRQDLESLLKLRRDSESSLEATQSRTKYINSNKATTTTEGADGEKIAAEIWERFQELSGAEREPSPKELGLLRELLAEGYTAEQICAAMEEVFANFRPKFKGDRIQSFAYCVPRIREVEPAGRESGRGLEEAEKLWTQINGAPPNAFEREELARLALRCDEVARQAPYPELPASGGAGWVAAAIADAARAGSQFIALRRVEVIIERWMAEEPPWKAASEPERPEVDWEDVLPIVASVEEEVGEMETAKGRMAAGKLWQQVLSDLALQMTKPTFDTWLRNTRPVACEDNTLIIGVQSIYAREWLENRLLPLIRRSVMSVAGCDLRVKFTVRGSASGNQEASQASS